MGRAWMVVLGLLAAQAAGAAGVYKWVDANGQVHFGERPPASAQADEVAIQKAPPPDAATLDRLSQQRKLLDSIQEQRNKDQETAKTAAADKAKRKQDCVQARDNLRRKEEARYLYKVDEKGERQIYSDAEREAAMKRARDQVAKYCD